MSAIPKYITWLVCFWNFKMESTYDQEEKSDSFATKKPIQKCFGFFFSRISIKTLLPIWGRATNTRGLVFLTYRMHSHYSLLFDALNILRVWYWRAWWEPCTFVNTSICWKKKQCAVKWTSIEGSRNTSSHQSSLYQNTSYHLVY